MLRLMYPRYAPVKDTYLEKNLRIAASNISLSTLLHRNKTWVKEESFFKGDISTLRRKNDGLLYILQLLKIFNINFI